MINKGSIILAYLPQADGGSKLRPVLILRKLPTYDDYLVCGIFTQLHRAVQNFDIVLVTNKINNLRTNSLARLSFLSVLTERDIQGVLGQVEKTEHQQLLQNLSNYLVHT